MKSLEQMTPAERQRRVAELIKNPGTRAAVPTKFLPAAYQQQRQQNDPSYAAHMRALAANPGTRAKVDAQYLTPAQRQQRALNARLDADVAPGLTGRDLAHQRTAATTLQFGPDAVGRQERINSDMANAWQGYADQVAKGEQDIKDIGTSTGSQIAALVAGMPRQDTTGQSAQNQTDAANGAAVRAAILNNIGAVQRTMAGNANTAASTLAHVIAPAQKLQAIAQGTRDTQDLRDKIAAFQTKFDADTTGAANTSYADQQKTQLALASLGVTSANNAASNADATARTSETIRSDKARERQASTDAAARARERASAINQYGYTNAEWAAMTTDQRRKIIASGKTTRTKSPWLGPSAQTAFESTFESARSTAQKYKGQYSRGELSQLLLNGRSEQSVIIDSKTRAPILQDGLPVTDISQARKQDPNAIAIKAPAIAKVSGTGSAAAISAALDAVYDGHLSKYTIDKIHNAKLKVDQLGVPTKPKRVVKRQQGPTATTLGPVGVAAPSSPVFSG